MNDKNKLLYLDFEAYECWSYIRESGFRHGAWL